MARELAGLVHTAHETALRAHQALEHWALAGAARPTPGAPTPVTPAVPAAVIEAGEAARRTPAREAGGFLRASVTYRHEGELPSAAVLRADTTAATEGAGSWGWTVHHGAALLAEAHGLAGEGAREAAAWPVRPLPGVSRQFRALARATRDHLGPADVEMVAAGRPGSLCRVTEATHSGAETGRYHLGRLTATVDLGHGGPSTGWPALLDAAWQALHLHTLHQGLHTCLVRPALLPWAGKSTEIEVLDTAQLTGSLTLEADIAAIGLVPRPHVVADMRVHTARGPLARLHNVAVILRERPGTPVGPGAAVRQGSQGETPAYANELHMAHAAEGDLHVAYGSPVDAAHPKVRPRLPRGDLLMLDRLLTAPPAEGEGSPESVYVTEYDVPAAPWYVRENGGNVPHLMYLESSLQAAAFVGAALGASLEFPDENVTVRNLEGKDHMVRRADLLGRTVRQRTRILARTPLPGAVLQRYGYELSVDDEVFYRGESVHGFFTETALASQQGLDGGRLVPPWLRRQASHDVRAVRPDLPALPVGQGRFAFLSETESELVRDGGSHGRGYLLCTKPVRADDWYFAHHFLNDPVMPGSCGVELLIQMVKGYLLCTDIIDEKELHALRTPPGAELRWTYRGQILPRHQEVHAEIHLRRIHRDGKGLTAWADGSVWRDGLRIYAVDNIVLQVGDSSGEQVGHP
ncbi:3-hydroxyacyl-ACP dehydratase [Streptomyces sp. BG9H]|uniref:3-hydroxyacyl-ACP dehydratase n=1 Tax=Streptomyces anatolicus TaxID=2675858 RepID=A0ABS6YQU3_9ACTN|nr:3-hydroxyacyl-ACP dehydratase [Streptomyces anatolicus]MBW5423798.1 3-hydroxyacyl-ACP dehydratase [Streptomyces anatolicus]